MGFFEKAGLLPLTIVAITAPMGWASPPLQETVRDDWYFRQSLAAIDDWEAILARLETEGLEDRLTPRLPVLASGETVVWPNPIPRMLMPPQDRDLCVGVRMVDGKIEVLHVAAGQATSQTMAQPGTPVIGYRHPGGGGKDQWYHAYHRRFDRLTAFAPVPAPFAIRIDTPLDLERGRGELVIHLSNPGNEPRTLSIQTDRHTPQATTRGDPRQVVVGSRSTETVRLAVHLDQPGGMLIGLTFATEDQSFWLPILTHVEQTAPVLEGIEKILADTPDPQAEGELSAIQERARRWLDADSTSGDRWREVFEAAQRLRDRLLLARLDFDAMLLVKRKPYFSEQPFMDAHHLFNRPGGGIYRLSPPAPDGKLTPVVDRLGEGVYRDVCLDFDAGQFLFSFGNGSDKWDGGQSYDIYQARVDGSKIERLTSAAKNDCEPFYLPDGKIGFTSDRSEHFVMCGGNRHSPTLFVMNADGSEVRQLSFNVFNDFNPTVLPDGRILYSRWEYNERSVTSLHNPFTMNPDGTMVAPYYGNATIRPNVVMFPRPVPGSRKIMALFTAHHGQTHGPIGLIDVRRGIDGPASIEVLTPGVPITGEKAEDSRAGWYSDPVPLSESTYLCSYTPTVLPWLETTWAIYVGDRHGNLALVYNDPLISCAEPVPLVPRVRPHVRQAARSDTDQTQAEATLLLSDVYVGLSGVQRGEARYLRVLEDVPRKSVPEGGVILTSGASIYTVKRILGTVPIESDGSAHFVVPANRNVYFEVLDAQKREIQRMRSVVCLKPNEVRGCIGCHERRNMAPPGRLPTAMLRRADHLQPPPWGTEILSFLRDVQPVLNAQCVRCHTHDRIANRVILTDDLTDQFTVGYQELLGYLSVANAMRWDNPDDVYAQPPYTYGSKTSPLAKILDAGHYDVELSAEQSDRLMQWIDANGAYYDRYEHAYGPKRQIFTGGVRKTLDDVYERRCATCHGHGDGSFGTWWLSLNRRDVTQSRALAAPLARPASASDSSAESAAGWGRCRPAVFADTTDPDYRALLAAFTALLEQLQHKPRADLASIRGTEAERQAVSLPPPPPPSLPDPAEADGDWVYLSNLAWESARAGWTRNGDGLPRRDRDVLDEPLKLGLRRYARGIGTHAPSEIVYNLDGQYARLVATVGGAEARGTVVFQVFGDGGLLAETGLMHGLRDIRPIDVPLKGVRRLRLVVSDGGDNYFSDMANWADARLLKQ
jgi:hypothetical protein